MTISKSKCLTQTMLFTSVLLLVVSCGSGGGSSDSSDISFPNPGLPAGAVQHSAGNAVTNANSAVAFLSVLSQASAFKSDAALSVEQALKLALDHTASRIQPLRYTAERTEDISSEICVSGSAIADYDDTSTSASGDVTFAACNVGSGILINGTLVFDASWNNTTLAYNDHFGGTLVFSIGADSVTVVLNLIETGNLGTGSFSSSISYSLDGIPGGGFLVTTTQNIVGNALSAQVTSGQIIVQGGNNTRLRITITTPNVADVDLDPGTGTFAFIGSIAFTP